MATRRKPSRHIRGFVAAGILATGLFAGWMVGTLRQAAQGHESDPSPGLCELPAPMQSFDSPRKMPTKIIGATLSQSQNSRMPGEPDVLAERDSAYNETDVVHEGLPSRRFIQGGRNGDYWFVWYERGGFVKRFVLTIFEMSDADRYPRVASGAEFAPGRGCWELVARLTNRQ